MAPNLRIEDIKPISNFVLLAVQVDGYCQAMTTALQLNQLDLDRIDALLFVSPVTYLYAIWVGR